MCINYYALKQQMINDKLPVPRIDSLLDRLHVGTVLCKLDLTSGYHQIDVEEDSIERTTL